MESERILARAEDALRRHGMEPRLAQRARAARRRSFFGKVKRIAAVAGVLTVGLPLWGLFIGPVGAGGLMWSLNGSLMGIFQKTMGSDFSFAANP